MLVEQTQYFTAQSTGKPSPDHCMTFNGSQTGTGADDNWGMENQELV